MSNKGNIICRQAKHLNNLSFKNNFVKIIPSHFTKGWAYLYSEWSSKLCLRTAFYCVCSCRRRFHQKILIQLKYYSLHRYPHLSHRVTDGGNWTDPRRNKLTQLQRSYFVTYSEQQLPTRIVKKAEKNHWNNILLIFLCKMTVFYQGEAAAVSPRKSANSDWTQQWVWNMRFLLIMIAGNNYCLSQFPLNCDNRKFDAATRIMYVGW